MAEPGNDPRVFQAAERTLLAWVRTGLSVIGMGFVVARFELAFSPGDGAQGAQPHIMATILGMGLVTLGAVKMAMATWTHVRFCRTLAPHERPRVDQTAWTIAFALSLSVFAVLMAGYIVLRAIE